MKRSFITDAKEIAKILNYFFSNIKTLKYPLKNHGDSNFENARDPTLKAIQKYCKHRCILAI